MPVPRGSGSKRGGATPTLNGHASHSLTKKRSQRFDSSGQSSTLGPGKNSIDVDPAKAGSDDSMPERDPEPRKSTGLANTTCYGSTPKDSGNSTIAPSTDSQKRLHVGQPPSLPAHASKGSTRSTPATVLPPHQYLDSLAITFFLVNLPTIFLVLIHLLFVIFAVSPYSSATERYSSWKTLLLAEAFIVLFFALVSPSIRALITELAEPVIASTLAGNGGRGTAICATIMFAAGRVPNVLFSGFIRLKRTSPGACSDTLVLAANDLETESEALDRLGDELQAWLLALIRQLIAIHVVARWSWEGLKTYLTNRVNQNKLEDVSSASNVDPATLPKKKKALPLSSNLSKMPLWTTIANNYIVATKDAELKPPEDLEIYLHENESALHIREITPSSVRLYARGSRQKLSSSLGPFDSFDVCVNGLQWREVSISVEEDDRPADETTLYHQESVCLNLDIQALVSSTANEIEIINSTDPGVVLFHATICTIQKEATAATATLAPQLVRPNSPISTLTDKLNNAVENLNQLKNTQRRIRKDHKSTVASLRSEIDILHSRLDAPDKGEERARRGNLALKYHVMQTEEKIRKLEEEIQHTEQSIADREQELASGREKWEAERSALDKSRRIQNETKSNHDKFLQQFHSEKLAINARKEKLTSREVKLKCELEVLEAAEWKKHEETDGRARRRQEMRNQLIKERQASQAEQVLALEQLETQLEDVKELTARANAERLVLETISVVSPPQTEMDLSSQTSIAQDSQDMLLRGNDSFERPNGSPIGGSFKESKD